MPKSEAERKATAVYEKGWWVLFVLMLALFVASLMRMDTAHTSNPVTNVLFLAMLGVSMLLGVYSASLFRRLPYGMSILGLLQAILFGFRALAPILLGLLGKALPG